VGRLNATLVVYGRDFGLPGAAVVLVNGEHVEVNAVRTPSLTQDALYVQCCHWGAGAVLVWCDVVWCGLVWPGVVWCGVALRGCACVRTPSCGGSWAIGTCGQHLHPLRDHGRLPPPFGLAQILHHVFLHRHCPSGCGWCCKVLCDLIVDSVVPAHHVYTHLQLTRCRSLPT
jgi:hypothetical protein